MDVWTGLKKTVATIVQKIDAATVGVNVPVVMSGMVERLDRFSTSEGVVPIDAVQTIKTFQADCERFRACANYYKSAGITVAQIACLTAALNLHAACLDWIDSNG